MDNTLLILVIIAAICVIGLTILIVYPMYSYSMKGIKLKDKIKSVLLLILCALCIAGTTYIKGLEDIALENMNRSEVVENE